MDVTTNTTESGTTRLVIAGLSVLVVIAVGVVVRLIPSGGAHSGGLLLPTINAGLNAFATVCLVLGYVFIRGKNVRAHRASMLAAFGASSLFLVTYLLHHAQVGS